MTFASRVQEAQRISTAMGTWVFHEAARADDVGELIGFLRYCSVGLEAEQMRQRKAAERTRSAARRAQAEDRAQQLRMWIGSWRKATRWLLSLDQGQASEVASAVLRQLNGADYYVECGHPYLTEKDEPRRRPGRPRVKALSSTHKECAQCSGFGWL